MRWATLGLVGCVWTSEADLRDRLDHDGDGYPVDRDCNDEDSGFFSLGRFEGAIPVVCGYSDVARTAPTELEISACPDPGSPNGRLPFYDNAVYALVPDPALPLVTATVTVDDFTAFEREDGDGLRASLFALRGPACAEEDCRYALPLREPLTDEEEEDEPSPPWESTTRFTVEPGDSWFLVVAGSIGAGTLTVTCAP